LAESLALSGGPPQRPRSKKGRTAVVSKPKVVVTRRWPDEVEAKLSDLFDAELNRDDHAFDASALKAALAAADALLPTVTDRLGADVLGAPKPRARLIANFGVGYNHIDVEAAKRHGFTVTNTPEVLTDCTADLAMTLLLMAARRAGEGERHVRAKAWTGWRPTHMMGAKVTGRTLGLVGLGRIGQAVARRARDGFGMRVVFCDPFPPPAAEVRALGAEARDSVEDVLREADFVSLHCPGGGKNRHLIDATRLALMKRTAFLVNTARGDVVDERALAEALRSGKIAGAGLDVFEEEPKVAEALIGLDNVVLLPHLGSATRETRVAMGMRVIENAEAFFAGRPPRDRVA
jgi:lactate dehydrogenase-like 2-hydroxyacid dehydrogenase